MEFEELMKFVRKENIKLGEYFGQKEKSYHRALAQTVKLGEEYGELCDEILSANKDQRKEKLESKCSNLDEELADVILTTLLLSDIMNVDIENSIKEKMKKVEKRYKQ